MCMRSVYNVEALTLCAFRRPFKVVPGKDNKPMIEGVHLHPFPIAIRPTVVHATFIVICIMSVGHSLLEASPCVQMT